MKRTVLLAVLGAVVSGAIIVTAAGAQVYPVRWDEPLSEPQPAAPTPPSLVLADGGIEFPDGSVQTTAVGGSPAPVPRTGQTTCYNVAGTVVTCGTGIGLDQDGDLQLGVTWPNPRFTDNGNGTVTDHLTGLIWLEDANCYGLVTWTVALSAANALQDSGTPETTDDCGLSDDSVPGQWRLGNVRELQSLMHYGVVAPAVPNTVGTGQWGEGDPFSGIQLNAAYWSSTTYANSTDSAWRVDMFNGSVNATLKSLLKHVWPVRGGQ